MNINLKGFSNAEAFFYEFMRFINHDDCSL